ncbi:hypothetical protein MLD38_030556 [Melastoma candidum]|uniref:Uncharacterized protein n=1 Tax=Melastoma candidum TaxID=119954 RepID=A0ACB9MM28_9MYRT|nr:hypothetical protein MLD38_030556 [Melastoma candidum]
MDSAKRFYLVKLQEFRNPDLVAAEELLRLQRVIVETRRLKSVYKDQLYIYSYCSSYDEDLRALRVSLDKLTFGNKRSLIKAARPNSPVEDIDNLGLHFGMLHGRNNLADERKILKKLQTTRRNRNPCLTLEDYDSKIRNLLYTFDYGRHDSAIEKKKIWKEISELKFAKEEAVWTAVCKGEIWESLGNKDEIQKKIKIMQDDVDRSIGEHLKINAEAAFKLREFKDVDKDLARMDKLLSDIDEIMGSAYKCFLEWRNEHQQANVCYNQNVSLLNDARKLAEKKYVASLHCLCKKQTATFMEKWNNDEYFRKDYTRRASISLNSRSMCSDGRTRNRDEAPIAIGRQMVKMPRRLVIVVGEIKSAAKNMREIEGERGN